MHLRYIKQCLGILSVIIIMGVSEGAIAKIQPQLSDHTYKVVNSVQRLVALKNYDDALEKLGDARESTSRKYDQAVLLQQTGYIYSMLSNYKQAIHYFDLSLKTDGLPVSVAQQVRYGLGQLYLAEEQYRQSIKTLEQWFKVNQSTDEPPQATVYVTLASAYAQIEDYKHVIKPMKTAISMTKEPNENWYLLLMASYHELKQYRNMIGVLETLTQKYPNKKQYWMQLSGAYMEIGKEKDALSALEMPYQLGMLTKAPEIMRLVNFEAYMGIPYRAASILDKALQENNVERSVETLDTLANFYHQAKDLHKAIQVYEASYRLKPSVDKQSKISKLMLQDKDYVELIKFTSQPAKDADFNDKAELSYLRGMAYFELKQHKQALQAMQSAAKSNEVKSMAVAWIQYLKG
ncbi:tetratricopeptide repeat protein [Vibrio tritonius]|uniref:tetratricopeptide repeat protein n=1 Tax=Vibrio tritonius TaxID=1435069 RepID=UPI0008398BA7|nr:tetratricopeptide repeat protein [Vibrio tritonius]